MGTGKTYSTKYLLDSNNSSGVAGQVLSTTSTGIDWVDSGTLSTGLWLKNGNNIYNSNSGNVGVGTTGPTAKLHVLGGSNDTIDETTANFKVQGGGGNGTMFGTIASSPYTSYIQSAYVVDTSLAQYNLALNPIGGNVGIGTTSPGAKLTVSENAAGLASSITNSSSSGSGVQITAGNGTNNSLQIRNYAGGELMRVQGNGNVGIGTTSPLHDLQIGTAATNGSYSMMIEGNFANNALASNPRLNLIDTNFGITAGKYGSGSADDALGIFGFQGAGRGILFAHTTAGSGTHLKDMRHDMFVDGGTGNVGIGTTSPTADLSVGSTATSSGDVHLRTTKTAFSITPSNTNAGGILLDLGWVNGGQGPMKFGIGSAEKMRIDNVGAVLIGGQPKIDTATKLQVGGNDSGVTSIWSNADDIVFEHNTNLGLTFATPNDAAATIAFADPQSVQAGWIQYLHDVDAMRFGTNGNSERMRISSAGNVGIGATNPLRKLHVVGQLAVNNATTEYYGVLMSGGEGADPSVLIGDWHNSSGTIKWDSTGSYLRIDSQHSTANAAILFSGNDGSTEYMRIASTGNVGIGTTTVQNKLVVRDSGSAFNSTLQNSTASIISKELTDNAYHSILQLVAVRQSLTTGKDSQGYLGFSTVDDSNNQGQLDAGRIAIVNETGSSRNSATALTFWTNPGGTQTTAAVEKMRISSAGAIKFNAYGAGTLVTDASGNITVSSGGGAGGPYLPLTAGSGSSLTDNLYINNVDQNNSDRYGNFRSEVGFTRSPVTGNPNQWFKVVELGGSPKRIKFSIISTGDNTKSYDNFLISTSGYGMYMHIEKLPGGKYNTSKLLSVAAVNPNNGGSVEIWIKLGPVSSGTGTTYVACTSDVLASATILASATTTAPTLTANDTQLDISNDNRLYATLQASRGATFGAKVGIGTNAPAAMLTVAGGDATISGNVGIGTTSTSYALDVEAGDTGAALGDSTTAAIFRAGRQNVWFQNQRTAAGTDWNNNTFKIIAKIDTTSHQSINFVNDASFNEHIDIYTGNQVFNTRFNANGNVGIGTTTPTAPLHIEGGTNSEVLKIEADSNPFIRWVENGTDVGFLQFLGDNAYLSNMSNGSLFIRTNNTDKMTITSAGNVGIGTTLPDAKLDVIGQGIFQGSTTSSYKGANVGTLNINNNSADGTVDFTQGLVFTDNVTNQGSWTHAGIVSVGSTGYNGSLVFGTDGDGVRNTSGITEKMRITSGGNVGIGTDSPDGKLEVSSNSSLSSYVTQYTNDADGAELVIRTARGTQSSPVRYNTNDSAGRLLFQAYTSSNQFEDAASIESVMESGYANAYGGLRFNYMPSTPPYTLTEGMRLNKDGEIIIPGNVGIGATSPQRQLHVNSGTTNVVASFESTDGYSVAEFKDPSGTAEIGNEGNDLILLPAGVEKLRITSTGDIELASSSRIVLDDQPAASTASGSGTIVKWSVSDATTAGTLYTVKTNGLWTPVDADNESTSIGMLAIALGTNAMNGMLLQGFFYKASHGFTIGLPLYISNTAGAFSTTRPTGTNDYVRIIGYATSANYIYFDPDKTWVKVA